MATDLLDLFVKVNFDSSEFTKGIESTEASFSKFGKKIKAGVGALAKVTAGAVAAGAAAVGKIVSDSVSAYGSYEQLVGGVETLFGNAAQTVLENSEKAFRTAGMSMNEYMETSIQSAAALINSLGGDQAKAAELMDMSITDMSDNVNKMGTTMEAVQNAYRGFSRGNFTMLDNLALGFSGTKAGMEELLEKAEQISGIHYDIESYADIVKAIHEVQKAMGITGTTAAEAADTIQGSAGSMKAAWENLKIELTKENGDISKSIDILFNSALTVFDNIEPKIERALGGMSQFVEKAAPVLVQKSPPMINKIIPPLISASSSLVAAIGQGLFQAIPAAIDSGIGLMGQINKALRGNSNSESLLQGIFNDITARIPTVFRFGRRILEAIADDLIHTDFGALTENLQKVFQSAMSNLKDLVDDIDWEQVGKDISDANNGLHWDEIIQSTADFVGTVIKNTPDLLKGIVENLDFENAADLIAIMLVPKAIKSIAKEVAASSLWPAVTSALSTQFSVSAGAAAGKAALTMSALLLTFIASWGIGTLIRKKLDEAGLGEYIDGMVEEACKTWELGMESISDSWEQLKQLITMGWPVIESAASNALTTIFTKWVDIELVISRVLGLIENVKNAIAEGYEKVDNYVGAVQMMKDTVIGRFFNQSSAGSGGHRATGGVIISKPVYDRSGNLYGEAGREALLPLDSNTGWMDQLAEKLNGRSGMVVQNLNITVEGGRIADDYDTDRFIERVAEKLGALSVRQERAVGGTGWTY